MRSQETTESPTPVRSKDRPFGQVLRATVLCCFWASATTLSQQIEYETMSGLIDRGSQAFAQGDYPQAASAFLKLQSLYSNEPAWHASRLSKKIMPLTGYASLKAGLYEQAVDSLETFLQQDNPAYSQETFAKYSIALALKRNGDFPAALDAFSAFRESSHSTSQQSIARIHEADIHFKSDQPEAALKILSLVIESDAAIRIRTQARLLATREYLNQKNFSDVSRLLLESSWSSDTMPELAMLAFLSIEAGDAFLANNFPKDALKAYQLVPNKDTLIKQQTDKLDQLKGIFESRRKSVGMGGIMWTDFYEQLLSSATAQLEALQQADDYSDALLLRRGRASLLSNRPYEAWLLFERVARFSEDDIAEQGQFHWILAAKELGRYANAIGIAREYLDRYPSADSVDDALYLIAHTLMDARRFEDAIQALSELAKGAAEPELRTACIFQRGQCYLRIGKSSAARNDFEQVVTFDLNPALAEKSRLWVGISHFLERSFEEAQTVFKALSKETENHELKGEALYRSATSLYSLYRYKDSESVLQTFLIEHPSHPREYDGQLLLGDCLFAQNRFEDAIKRYRSIPVDFPELAHLAALQSSDAYRELGLLDESLAVLRRRAKLSQKPHRTIEILLASAHLQLESDDSSRALASLDETIEKYGDNLESENLFDVLQIRHSLKPFDLPQSYKEAIDHERLSLAARFGLLQALEYRDRRQPFRSKEIILNIANEIPHETLPPECLAHIGLDLVKLDFESGVTLLERLIHSYPESEYRSFAYFGFAQKEADANQLDTALGWLNRIPESDFDSPIYIEALALEGRIRSRLGEYATAQKTLERIFSFRWANSQQKADTLIALAELKSNQGEPKQAIAYYQRVFTLYPGIVDAAAKGYLGSAKHLAEINEPVKAHETLNEFLGRSEFVNTPQFPEAKILAENLSNKINSNNETGGES